MSYINGISYEEDSSFQSPGLDYQSLLNDFSSSSRSKVVKTSHIETEEQDESTVAQLRAENLYLKQQIKVILKEKDMHIISSAQERLKIDREISNLKNSLELDLIKFRKENENLAAQNKELLKRLTKNQSNKEEKVKFYKSQLEKLEKHYSVLINDKDRTISILQNELSSKKRRLKSKPAFRTASSFNFPANPLNLASQTKLDDISKLIVKLEKQQADLKESIIETGSNYDCRNLKELSEGKKKIFKS